MVHSLRHFEKFRMADRMLWSVAACVCSLSLATSFASAQEASPRSLLTQAQIVSAMQSIQLPTHGVKVRLAAAITAGVANPQLEIQAIALLNPHEMRLRMTCRDRSQCLSFFAIATYPEDLDPAVLPIKPDQQLPAPAQPVPPVKPVAEAPAVNLSAKPPGSGEPQILRSGSPATLDFDGERVHVRVEVICLQGGAAGDKIRVTTRDRKQVYVAEIVTPVLLKGTF